MSTADQPRLAVVIPTYNRARTIERAVRSVLSHPRGDIELAVVDDCSTDDTQAVLSRIVDPRLRVIRTDRHAFANHARNVGVARTTAPLIAFLDSDDEFQPARVGRLIEFFATQSDADAAFDGFGVVHHQSRTYMPPFCVVTGDTLVRMLICHSLPLTNSALAIRRAAFDDVGGFDGALLRQQDRDIMLRLARRHRVALGTGLDVVKHQSVDSISRDAAGYIAGFDALVARHPVFTEPWARDILGYLVARCVIREIASLRWRAAWSVAQTIGAAEHLPVGVASALVRYRAGRRLRRVAEAELAAMGQVAPSPRLPAAALDNDATIRTAKQES